MTQRNTAYSTSKNSFCMMRWEILVFEVKFVVSKLNFDIFGNKASIFRSKPKSISVLINSFSSSQKWCSLTTNSWLLGKEDKRISFIQGTHSILP